MVAEVLEVLAPKPGETAVDATLGYGGHARELLPRLLPGGRLIGLDADSLELPKTEARLRELGYGPESLTVYRTNFAGLPRVLRSAPLDGVDLILADLGVSSMQLDNPARGFSVKFDGPLDMRMNPNRGQSASDFLAQVQPDKLAQILTENADEPQAQAQRLAAALAGKRLETTRKLTLAIHAALTGVGPSERDATIRRVFQALRIAVNDEFSALDAFLRQLPWCLNPGGRVAVLSFHSGEDRRVKKAFAAGLREGLYSAVSDAVMRPSAEERRDNPRSSPAKLRWAKRGGVEVSPVEQ
jgi:16S rRNA (cytosine1402-N4)-methyltransferase